MLVALVFMLILGVSAAWPLLDWARLDRIGPFGVAKRWTLINLLPLPFALAGAKFSLPEFAIYWAAMGYAATPSPPKHKLSRRAETLPRAVPRGDRRGREGRD